ncbi:MAG: RNB domain-containing ribonuclease [Neisseriaceae bacterium]|nr:RNB domain-containing ribonuclease [Neisseriaceae bacterium]
MNIFYEESGQFKVATVIQKNDASYQADTVGGKRVKIKANNVFVEFDTDAVAFLENAQQQASEIDIPLLWEVVGECEFTAEAAAGEYFGQKPNKSELAATLIALYAAPMYFYKKNKGVFKAAPEETLKQALAAIERKKQQDAQMAEWIDELKSFRLPENIAVVLPKILHTPDKQTLEYKAFIKAAEVLKLTPFELAQKTGGVSSLPQYLLDGFVLNNFPQGIDFPEIACEQPQNLPVAENIKAFSIDDIATTEIDDALSLTKTDTGFLLGIHIAAPTLSANDAIHKIIHQRQSTLYFPTGKITMLPENWISAFSLDENGYRPCVSVYFYLDENAQFVGLPQSKIEQVWIEKNLRIQEIEPFFNRLSGCLKTDDDKFDFHAELKTLWQIAISLQKQRGKYEEDAPIRYEYSVEVDENGIVTPIKRERDAPIDTVVGEMMILANKTWAEMLDQAGLGGIFRVQEPKGQVRLTTQSSPHDGLGVSHYAWHTSPLRRATDFINQQQLISLIDGEQYTPRFDKNDNQLFAAVRDFETAYTAYKDFQQQMERYWSLVYLQQNAVAELTATLLKGDLVRIDGLPLVARATGIPIDILPRTLMKLRVGEIDLITQSVALQYMNVLAA